jgi:hypothetical protein
MRHLWGFPGVLLCLLLCRARMSFTAGPCGFEGGCAGGSCPSFEAATSISKAAPGVHASFGAGTVSKSNSKHDRSCMRNNCCEGLCAVSMPQVCIAQLWFVYTLRAIGGRGGWGLHPVPGPLVTTQEIIYSTRPYTLGRNMSSQSALLYEVSSPGIQALSSRS